MENLTCASSVEQDRFASLNFIISQSVDLITSFFTYMLSIIAIKMVLKQSIFETSTKILLFLNIFYANLYQIVYSIDVVVILYKHFFMQEEVCSLLILESSCAPFLETLIGTSSGMMYCQTGLLIERFCATFLKTYNGKKTIFVGSFIAIVVMISTTSTGKLVIWDDPLDDAVLACFIFPKKSKARSTIHFYISTVVSLFNLAASVALNKYNKTLEYQVRFKICARFHKRQVIESTETICFLNFTQFVFMFIYSSGNSTLKSIRDYIQPETYNFWVVWCYTVPFIALTFPLLLIYKVKSTRGIRAQKIVQISNTKQTQDEHINQMKVMWE